MGGWTREACIYTTPGGQGQRCCVSAAFAGKRFSAREIEQEHGQEKQSARSADQAFVPDRFHHRSLKNSVIEVHAAYMVGPRPSKGPGSYVAGWCKGHAADREEEQGKRTGAFISIERAYKLFF
jgi:hypothetical protein